MLKLSLRVLCLGTLITILSVHTLAAQESTSVSTSDHSEARIPTLNTVKALSDDSIILDGKLVEPIWQRASVATGFTQRSPKDGEPASEKTTVRVIYTENAIYIGARAFDSAMDSVAATLFRKDGSAYSDWFYVNIDSYNDNRTGFTFAVNPRGVRKDILVYNDNNEDIKWDAVWEAATSINGKSWDIEIKIPLSQLRFNAKNDEMTWGVNFQRRIARKEEISFWSPTPADASGFVSNYGELVGIKDIEEPRQLELAPYVSTNLTRAPTEAGNPFYQRNDFTNSIGADLKYGLTSDLTLTATINPDFGQVEADPAVINLSAFETFFPEQRPFFLEGTDIFEFGRTNTFNSYGNPITFYSRRIGRNPQGNLSSYNGFNDQAAFNPDSARSRFTDPPDQTTIAAAAKLSGKTQSGWSIGVLDAYTVKEKSPFQVDQGPVMGTSEGKFPVEPATNYFVGRTKKDFNSGNTYVGGFLSAVNRSINDTYFDSFLHRSAYITGVDFEHSWNDRSWTLSGTFSGSQVNGSRFALLRTQLSPVRYYNRVDSDKLSVDQDKTSLNGFATEVSLQKSGGDHWRGSLTYSEVSPGYETNDMGFQNRANYRSVSYSVMYRENTPDRLRFYNLWTFGGQAWNYDGDHITNWYNIGSYIQFNNLWSFNFNINLNGKQVSDRLTRGGPIAENPRSWNFNVNINSNQTKRVSFNVGAFNRWDNSGERSTNIWGGIRTRPSTNIQLSLSPSISFFNGTDQYVTTVPDPLAARTFGSRYVFANIDQTTLSTTLRLDWTFTPDISLQTYLRPFISSGDFRDYKEFTTPGKHDFDIYGDDTGTIEFDESTGIYTVDPDGSGPAGEFLFGNRDFNFRSVQTNTVFRWEYKPGSTLFLVWQQDRSDFSTLNNFRFGRDFNDLLHAEPTNVFLVKLSYWIGT